MRCSVCAGEIPDSCLCHLAGDPAWDRHIAGRKALLLGGPLPSVLVPLAPEPVYHSPDFPPHAGPLDSRRELVVARYREPIAWTAAVPYSVRVYNAGPPIEPPAAHVRVIDRSNLGREAGAYLTHIVRRYHRLAELTCFVQADPFDHAESAEEFLARLRVWYDAPTTLTTRYLTDHPAPEIKARDRVETVNGFTVRYGLATAGHRDGPDAPNWLDKSIWSFVFNCPEPDPWLFGYGNMWAVPRTALVARPLSFWTWLHAQVFAAGLARTSRSDPPTNAWMVEAIARYLWSDPATYPHHDREPACGGCGGRA